jgi:hypothetical protein
VAAAAEGAVAAILPVPVTAALVAIVMARRIREERIIDKPFDGPWLSLSAQPGLELLDRRLDDHILDYGQAAEAARHMTARKKPIGEPAHDKVEPEDLVRVKRRCKRGRRSSHLWISEILWVA